MESKQSPQPNQTVIINQTTKKSNGIGTAGFIIALIALFIGWIPYIGWFLWFLGILFSFIGIFKKPRGMAIAGLIISLIEIIIILFLAAAIATAIGINM